MRKERILCLLLVVGISGLAFGQKKPREYERQKPQAASPEQNKATARRVFEEIYSQGRFGEVNQVYAASCKVTCGGRSQSLQEAVSEARGWKSAAPDLAMSVQQVSASGDVVTVNWVARGTHTGQGNGLKPTGKRINMRGQTQFRFANGKIVEANTTEYRQELFRQLGVSKTAASMIDTSEKLLASLKQLFPDPLYASLQ